MTTFDDSKIVIVRLTSNEEVLGLLDSSEAPKIKLLLPFRIGITQAKQTQMIDGTPNYDIRLAPFLPLGDEDTSLEFPESIIAFKYRPNQDIRAKYKELYLKMTSGLVLPG